MARTKSKAVVESHEITAEQTPGLDKAVEAANLTAAIQADYNQGRDLVNQMLGQAQMAMASSDLLRTFGVSKMKFVKENKLYQQIAGMKTPNGSELRGTWVEFCELLGVSDDKANEDIANLSAFGEAALESMNRIGIGYRDLRQFRRMPQDERLALIEAAKSGDKEELVELAEIMLSKHSKEKEEQAKQVAELKANLETKERQIASKDAKLNELDAQVAKGKKRIQTADPDAEAKQLREEVHLFAFEAEATILGKLTPGFEALAAHAEANDCTHEEFMAGCLCQIESALLSLRSRFNVKAEPDGDQRPLWTRPEVDTDAIVAANVAKLTADRNLRIKGEGHA